MNNKITISRIFSDLLKMNILLMDGDAMSMAETVPDCKNIFGVSHILMMNTLKFYTDMTTQDYYLRFNLNDKMGIIDITVNKSDQVVKREVGSVESGVQEVAIGRNLSSIRLTRTLDRYVGYTLVMDQGTDEWKEVTKKVAEKISLITNWAEKLKEKDRLKETEAKVETKEKN